MKALASVYVMCLCAVFGLARPDGENTPLGGEAPCLTVGKEGAANTFKEFKDKLTSCIMPDRDHKDQLEHATTIEDLKGVLKEHCDEKPILQECIVNTRDLAARCLTDPVERGKLKVQANLLKQVLEVSCLQDGARLASFLQQIHIRANNTPGEWFIDNCLYISAEYIDMGVATVSQYSLQLYQMLRNFKTCLADYTHRHEVGLEDMMGLLNEIADVLTCVGADSAEPILCKSLVEQRCAAHKGTDQQLYNTFLSQAVECSVQDENSSSIVSQFNLAHTAEEYQHIFKDICKNSLSARQCFVNTKLNGEFCIQGGFRNMFRGISTVMGIAQYVICDAEGVRLSNILAAIRAAGTTSDNFAERCFMAAVEGFKDEEKWRQNYRLVHYHVWTNLKNCIADYGKEHNQAAVDLASLLGEKLDVMRCFDDQTGHYVLCNTLVN